MPQAVLDAEWPLEVVQLPLLARMAWDEKALDAQEGALGGAPEEGALGESEGYASEEEGEGGVGGSRSSWMELLLAGAKDGAGVTLGCAPATAEEMEWVLETTGCSVIICLQVRHLPLDQRDGQVPGMCPGTSRHAIPSDPGRVDQDKGLKMSCSG